MTKVQAVSLSGQFRYYFIVLFLDWKITIFLGFAPSPLGEGWDRGLDVSTPNLFRIRGRHLEEVKVKRKNISLPSRYAFPSVKLSGQALHRQRVKTHPPLWSPERGQGGEYMESSGG
jgi:hypothetical protein